MVETCPEKLGTSAQLELVILDVESAILEPADSTRTVHGFKVSSLSYESAVNIRNSC
jgi:hypothetical protein